MNVALRIAPARAQTEPTYLSRPTRVARVEILDDLAVAEPIWRRLEREDALATPYQSFDLQAAWQRHVGARAGVSPFIVVGFDPAGKPIFLWPMGKVRKGPLNVVGFLGGKHTNFNLALWRRDVAKNFTAEDIRKIVAQIAAGGYEADVFRLLSQPRSWEGIVNPFALLPHQPSPSDALWLKLENSGDEVIKRVLSPSMRGRLRTKERRLQRLAGYRYLQATTAADVDRLLDAFFALKAAHMAEQGLANVFAEPSQESFLREACHQGLAAGKPLIEIHALEAEGELLALFAGVSDGRRFSGMFNTYTRSDNARQSPGLVLLTHMITALADRGLKSFDLGVGEARYKTFFCKEPEPLFDNFLPLTRLGWLAAMLGRLGYGMKRRVKQSRLLWKLVQVVRQSRRPQAADAA
jgi:CelD/BcsL family acetyltransferase involved in cellulose biosynthesis